MLSMIIDAHTHIFSKDVIKNRDQYCSSDACFGLLYSHPKTKLLSVEGLIESMDKNGISKSAVLNIGWQSHDLCVQTNDYILEAVAKYPAGDIGFCSLQPLDGEKAVKELERCHKAGAKGIGELRPNARL